ncbi:MAG: DUF973 family protein [Thermoplasmata archaeon]|nr:DUF973 family protein [Thermoplasmata archaeon]
MATPLPSPTSYPTPPPPPPGPWSTASRSPRRYDAAALSRIELGGALGILGALFGWGYLAVSSATSLGSTTLTTSSSGAPKISVSTGGVELLLALAAVSALLEVVQLVYLLGAFRELREFDDGFETPSKLVWLALIGLPLLLLAVALLLTDALSLAQCVNALPPGGSAQASCSGQLGSLVGATGLFLLAGVLSLIGWIALLLGVWRLGAHFNESNFRAAAILLIIPFLSVVGFVLIWYSSRRLGQRRARPGSEFL